MVVRIPSMLRQAGGPEEIDIEEPVGTIAELVAALDRRHPGLAAALDDSFYNFAVNDSLLLHGMRDQRLNATDVVEIIPTISGGTG